MRPVSQRNRHRPAEGIYGDCHRAAYASIMELDLDEVPHFFDQDRSWDEARPLFQEFWDRHGIHEITIPFAAELDDVLMACEVRCPGVPFILGGESQSGVNHSVVACGGAIVHDPSLNQTGIVGPCKPDGHYWVTYIVRRLHAK